jgi:succinate dehydrogenase hydrophobic anchor subunit
MKKQYIIPALLLMLVSITSHAQNGTRLIGFDAVTAGRGGTSTGFFDNPTLISAFLLWPLCTFYQCAQQYLRKR